MPTKKKTLAKLNSFLNANSPKLAFFLHHIWRNQQQAVTYKELREAIRRGEFDMSYMLQWQQDYSVFVNTYYAAVAQQAIDTATQELRAQYPVLEDAMPSLMDNFIQTQGGRLIREVTTSQYTAINTLVRQAALSDTMTGDQLARAIRPCIGLTQRQAQSVFHLHNDLIDQGIDAATAQKRTERYAEMVHRRRSALIAQTELAYAYNNGQQALMEEAVKNGTIAPGATKVWYTAADERVCESCGKMDMQEVPWDATFSNGKVTAPAHPNCRCAVAYRNLKPPAPQPKPQPKPTPEPQPTPEPEPAPKPKTQTGQDSERPMLLTTDDPIREILGSAFQSHPKQVKAIIADLQQKGVEIVSRPGALAYDPSLVPGMPGRFIIDPEASYSAWLHEKKHVDDDEARGWQGISVFKDMRVVYNMEKRAYDVEIDFAKRLGYNDIVKRLRALKKARREALLRGPNRKKP